jgi:eukaryotic-like serine/threonine-protein kinase
MLHIQRSTWELVEQSKLLRNDQLQSISNNPEAADLIESDPEKFCKWLVDKGLITNYHADVFQAGLDGPFVFDSYAVKKRVTEGPLKGSFRGWHRPTGHEVALHFMKGDKSTDLVRWDHWVDQCDIYGHSNPGMIEVYQAVEFQSYRFIVSEDIVGKTLIDKLPSKGRLPWQQACQTVHDVAVAIKSIHDKNQPHGKIDLCSVCLVSGGRAKLWPAFLLNQSNVLQSDVADPSNHAWYQAPEVRAQQQPSLQSDLYSLGCLLVRLLGSNPPQHDKRPEKDTEFGEKSVAALSKYELSNELNDLIRTLLQHSPKDRIHDAGKVVSTLSDLLKGESVQPYETLPANAEFKKWLKHAKSVPFQKSEKSLGIDAANSLEAMSSSIEPRGYRRQQSSKWLVPTLLAVALMAFMTVVAVVAFQLGQTKIGDGDDTVADAKGDSQSSTTNENGSDSSSANGTSTNNKIENKGPVQPPILIQKITEDDGERIWQSPTTGPAVNFDLVPAAPRVIFSIQLKALLESEQGQGVIKAMGPDFESLIDQWSQASSIPLSRIKHLTISLHTNQQNSYDACYLVEFDQALAREELLQLLGQPAETESGSFGTLYSSQNNFYLLPMPQSSSDTEPTLYPRILMGPKDDISPFVNNPPVNTLSGPLLSLSRYVDANRHFTVLFVRSALFNTEGQKLMKGPFAQLNRPFDLFLHDMINGVLLSFHLDDGTYLELMLEHTVDISSTDMQQWLDEKLSTARDQVIRHVASLSSNPYWDQVRILYPGMITQLTRETRIGVEHKTVIANCWLPPTALENLIVASDLALSSTPGVTVAVDKPTTPQSLKELLDTRRDIEIVSQDLINCIDNLKSEIIDDYGNLPFAFDIKLLGNDLRVEGITQNQRISDFSRKDQPFSTILTEMLFQANPDKNATGPKDPRCKLVWVIAPDPDQNDRQIILITTRTAATKNGWELPPNFQEE